MDFSPISWFWFRFVLISLSWLFGFFLNFGGRQCYELSWKLPYCFIFIQFKDFFLLPFWFLQWLLYHSLDLCLCTFCSSSCCCHLALLHCDQKAHRIVIPIFLCCWVLLCVTVRDLFQRMSHVLLSNMNSLVFYWDFLRCVSCTSNLWCYLTSVLLSLLVWISCRHEGCADVTHWHRPEVSLQLYIW